MKTGDVGAAAFSYRTVPPERGSEQCDRPCPQRAPNMYLGVELGGNRVLGQGIHYTRFGSDALQRN